MDIFPYKSMSLLCMDTQRSYYRNEEVVVHCFHGQQQHGQLRFHSAFPEQNIRQLKQWIYSLSHHHGYQLLYFHLTSEK